MEMYRKINLYFPWPLKAYAEHGKPKQKHHYLQAQLQPVLS